ncbi:auxin efflux carrier superfamily [Stagonosporopsis vannaccii]|nr:auxin efflux carrier superfamily [Stagonosporopsis vannaccii]
MVLNGFLASFVAAVQASLSVLLVISYGAIAARLGLLNASNSKAISKICVKMFLPALLLVQIGSELHLGSANRYLIILLWALACHFVSFLIGIFAHLVFGLPDWTTAAIMFNNTTSYPLLLIQSLEQTGILSKLIVEDETTRELIARAKSYFLVFATVSSCLTFAVGPRLIDTEHAPDSDDDLTVDEEDSSPRSSTTLYNEPQVEDGTFAAQPSEQTRLLPPYPRYRGRHKSVTNITFFPSKPKFTTVKRRPRYIPDIHWSDLSARTQWWLLFFYDFLNAPLLGAVLGVVIGMTPALHRAFFSTTYNGGIFTAWLTESWKNVGGLFVPLPLIVAGISLYTSYQDSKQADGRTPRSGTPLATTFFILVIRFVVWPVISIGLIYAIAKHTAFLGSDPMLWFAMMLMPTGPPALKIISMVQVSDASVDDERNITKILTVSYVISPVLAVVVVGALNTSSDNGVTPYYLLPGMGLDVAADPPVRRPPPPLPNRPAEPASDEVWKNCRDKGCTLTWAMDANDAEVGPAYNPQRVDARSPFRSFKDLEMWGWNPYPQENIDDSFHNFDSTWGIGEALVGLGVSKYSDIYKGGLNRIVCIGHRSYLPAAGIPDNQWYEANGKRYRATGAQYSMAINPKDGVIMGLSRLSPNYAATDRVPPVAKDQLPALNQFSDVAWIGWDALTKEEGNDIKRLRYFLSVGVVNPFTKSVIRRAMDAKGWELSPWPGHTFERRWFETRAIIGTPNVQGFAYMLIQHKDILGNMFIDKVQVFRANNASRNPCIVMHLAKPRAQNEKAQRKGAEIGEVEVVKVLDVQPLRAKL